MPGIVVQTNCIRVNTGTISKVRQDLLYSNQGRANADRSVNQVFNQKIELAPTPAERIRVCNTLRFVVEAITKSLNHYGSTTLTAKADIN